MIDYRTNPHPDVAALDDFWQRAWGGPPPPRYARVIERSLAHIGAYEGDCLIGFVNLAWDGGLHAFVLDTAVDPAYRRRGITTELVRRAVLEAHAAGVHWLHVDFEPHLEAFYSACGFRPTAAGLMRLGG